jgi:hypothetical protein
MAAKPDKMTAHVLSCGAMHCDLTWLLPPARAISLARPEHAGG